MSKFFGKKERENGNEADRPDRNRRRMCDEGKNVSERLKNKIKKGKIRQKLYIMHKNDVKLLWKNTFTFPYITGNIKIVTQK